MINSGQWIEIETGEPIKQGQYMVVRKDGKAHPLRVMGFDEKLIGMALQDYLKGETARIMIHGHYLEEAEAVIH